MTDKLKFLTFSFFLFILLWSDTWAASYNDGYEAFKESKYAKATEIWLPLAERGDMQSQFSLAIMYYEGIGVIKNNKESTRWLNKAAEQGHMLAQYTLGTNYYNGRGVPKDYLKAFNWYQKAAIQGEVRSQTNLGFMYVEGQGTQKNKSKAMEWYRKAADQGFSHAQFNLGGLYEHSPSEPENRVQAFKWLSLAKVRMPEEEATKIQKRIDELQKKMSPDEISEAKALVKNWKPRTKNIQ